MITINAKTKEVRNAREHEPQMYSEWFPEYNTTPGYIRGWTKPNYPVPVKLQTAWYSRIWQTKPNPFHSPRLYWDFIQGHFKLMRWL